MNAEKLLETVEFLLSAETEFHLQQFLEELRDHLNHLAGAPQEPSYQQNYHNAFRQFESSWNNFQRSITPALTVRVREINGKPHYLDDIAGKVQDLIQTNPITPSVVAKTIAEDCATRRDYVNRLTTLKDHLLIFGITRTTSLPSEVELGFFIPRSLFDNTFGRMVKELSEIQRIIRTFSELSTGTVDEAQVREISTSDPVFYLGLAASTATLIAGAVAWAIQTWDSVEKIRMLRTQIDAAQIKNDVARLHLQERAKQLVNDEIDSSIQEQANKLAAASKASGPERTAELRNALENHLRSILARVERGMTVEIKPPPVDALEQILNPQEQDIRDNIRALQSLLTFPQPSAEPILLLDKSSQDSTSDPDVIE